MRKKEIDRSFASRLRNFIVEFFVIFGILLNESGNSQPKKCY